MNTRTRGRGGGTACLVQAALEASLMELELTKNQGMLELAELEATIAASLALEARARASRICLSRSRGALARAD